MSTPPPSIFDDGGGLPETEPRPRFRDEERFDDLRPGGPNYFFRRALAVGAVVGVIAVAAIVVGQFIGDDDDTDSTAPSAEWNRIVYLTPDATKIVDPESGEVVEEFPAIGESLAGNTEVSGGVLVALEENGRLTQFDLADGTSRRARTVADAILRPDITGSGVMVVGEVTGGDVFVVDTKTRTVVDVAEAADLVDPLMFPDGVVVNRSGTHAAVSDAASFQTVLVDLAAGTTDLVAGQVAALDDTTLVTAQRAGDQTELEFYDLLGDRLASIDVATPRALMLTGEATVLTVDSEGMIFGVNAESDNVEELGRLDPDASVEPVQGIPVLSGDRLLVRAADDRWFVLDRDGNVLGKATGGIIGAITPRQRCIAVGGTSATERVFHVDTEDGATLGDVPGGFLGSTSDDGCAMTIQSSAQPRLIVRGVERPVDIEFGNVLITPDGSAYVVGNGREGLSLVAIPDEADEGVEPLPLPTELAVLRFANVP